MSIRATNHSAPRPRPPAPRPGGDGHGHPAPRHPDIDLGTDELLARHPAGRTPPLRVLDLIIARHNTLHTALEKTVSHKTRHDRAMFLRSFFRDLRTEAGFRRIPDPRSLGQKHVRAMVQVWQHKSLAPSTIQTYLSFLRGLALWLHKPGLIRPPEFYGLRPDEYVRNEVADRDRSWTPKGIDVDALLVEIGTYDARVAACMRLMQAFALRKKESLLMRPFRDVAAADETDLPMAERTSQQFVHVVSGKGGRPRWIALDSPVKQAALRNAQRIVATRDAHMGDPELDLQRNLRRLAYVMEKFGITDRDLGVTGHGLRHELANDVYEDIAGQPSPVRGGGRPVDKALDKRARLAVARLAGHSRPRASAAYIGSPGSVKAPKEDQASKSG